MSSTGLSDQALAWIQRCQAEAVVWSEGDIVLRVVSLAHCFTTVPTLRTHVDRVGVSSALLRLAWKAREGLRPAMPECSIEDRHLPRRVRVTTAVGLLLQLGADPATGLGELASRMELTDSHLSRILRRETGLDFSVLRHAIRMVEVIVLLRTSSLPIARVSDACGYRRTADLDRQFGPWFHMTPRAFRQLEFRDTRTPTEARAAVEQFALEHPETRPAEVADSLGIDFSAVVRYWASGLSDRRPGGCIEERYDIVARTAALSPVRDASGPPRRPLQIERPP